MQTPTMAWLFIAVYLVIFLDRFWSEEYGDPLYMGTERCFRIKDDKELLN